MKTVIGALTGGLLLLAPVAQAAPRDAVSPTMPVTIYFHHGEPDDPALVVPVTRIVPRTPRVATAALTELLGGPTAAERAAGYWSQFSSATAGMLRSVRVQRQVAYADFHDFRHIIPNASSSFGSTALLAELDTTLLRFPTIRSTVYSFNGDIAAFYEWLQRTPPVEWHGWLSAIGTARQFLTTVAGMNNPVAGPVRRAGSGAEVTFQARSPDGTPLPGITTVVSLRRDVRWMVTGAQTATILVDTPAAGSRVMSPVRVIGRSHTFEGTVTVRVLTWPGLAEVGRGFVTGGGDQLRPFSGDIAFANPGGGGGWLLFTEESAADGAVIRVTAVPVAFQFQTG